MSDKKYSELTEEELALIEEGALALFEDNEDKPDFEDTSAFEKTAKECDTSRLNLKDFASILNEDISAFKHFDKAVLSAISINIKAISDVLNFDKVTAYNIYTDIDFNMPIINEKLTEEDVENIKQAFDVFLSEKLKDITIKEAWAFDKPLNFLSWNDKQKRDDEFFKKLVNHFPKDSKLSNSEDLVVSSILAHGLLTSGVKPEQVAVLVKQLKSELI
ncbi:hypothetical protein A9299_10050 [Moraxella osloensis]|uniref:Uncharacterized protein n=1 Tax=Faucicola osloensis TaxID=34062 RepID=A0AA91JA20_FAUOS|nr:hypothetical protein A9299_10050 [Moraxella osloensis]